VTARALALAVAAAGVVAWLLDRARPVTRQLTGTLRTVRAKYGVPLRVEVTGPADAPPTVVLMHGFGGAADHVRPPVGCLPGGMPGWPVRSARAKRRP
jgi:hypothetical protein